MPNAKTMNSNVLDKKPEEVAAPLEFHIKSFFFNSDDINQIQLFIHQYTKSNNVSFLGSSLVTLVTELYYHSVIENFKFVFINYMIKEMGMQYLDQSEQENLFYAEMNSSRAENFKNLCLENNIFVSFSCQLDSAGMHFVIGHFGKLSAGNTKNIQTIIKSIESNSINKKLHQLFSENSLSDKYDKGMAMALFAFRGMGIPNEFFKIKNHGNKVSYTITIPLDRFQTGHSKIRVSNDNELVKKVVWEIFDELQLATVIFSSHGNIVEVSDQLLNILNISSDEIESLKLKIPQNFFEDLFVSPFSLHNFKIFENYRVSLPIRNSNLQCLFNVSGIKKADNTIVTLWQAVNIDEHSDKFNRGSLFENMNFIKMISPYIPKMVVEKAKSSIKQGLTILPVESDEATIFFADLAGFTQKSETMSHQEIVELLNLTMSNIVTIIERHKGYVDKFIGDGVMCIFFDTLSSVIAAIEIQNNLINLNEFRAITSQPLLDLRIGINSGRVILGSIGTKERMDWTALGDVVNTASRIESNTPINNVGISQATYEIVKENVTIKNQISIKLKGKQKEETLLFVDSVSFAKDGKQVKVALIQPGET